MNLGTRFLRGSLVLSAGSWTAQAVNLGIQIVIARWLGPSEFGLYAFCFAISEFLSILGAFSLQHALVQAPEVGEEDYDTAFVICAGLGGIGILLAGLIAPLLWAGRGPEAPWLLVVMMVAALGRLLAQPFQARLERDLRYGAVTVTNTVAAVVPNFAALGLAWAGWGVWSLAARDAMVGLGWFALSAWASRSLFRGRVSRDAWRRLMDFSRPLFVARTLETVIERLDAGALGLVFGNRVAGLYHWARSLAEIGHLGTRPLERVSLNLYSRLQGDPRRLGESVRLVNTFLLRVLSLGAVVLLAAPGPTVRIVLGEEWLDVSSFLVWLAPYGVLMPLFHNVKMLCFAHGDVRGVARIRAVQVAVFAAGVLLACLGGHAEGVAVSLLASYVLALVLAWRRLLAQVRVDLVRLAGPPLLAAGVALGVSRIAALGEVLPWYLLPAVPALTFLAAVFALEGPRLVADLRFLRLQLGVGGSGGTGAET